MRIRLPSGDGSTFAVHLNVEKRDQFGFTETIFTRTVYVDPDYDRFHRSVQDLELHLVNQTNGHLNTIIQEITAMAQLLNKNNSDNIDFAIRSSSN